MPFIPRKSHRLWGNVEN